MIYHSMPIPWENMMTEQGFNYINSTLEEMTGFFKTRVENLKVRQARKNLLQPPRKRRRRYPTSKGSKMTPTPV